MATAERFCASFHGRRRRPFVVRATSLSFVARWRSADELVAGAVHGEDVLRFVGRGLDLLPQLRDEVVDRPRRRRLLVAPDLVQDLLTGDDLTRVRDEIPEQIELACRELD